MTRLLFIPHDHTFLILNSTLSPVKLAADINANRWKHPKVVRDWLRQHGNALYPTKLCASVHGSLVIVTTPVFESLLAELPPPPSKFF